MPFLPLSMAHKNICPDVRMRPPESQSQQLLITPPGATSLFLALPSQPLCVPISLGSYAACPGEGETTLSCLLVTAAFWGRRRSWHSSLHSNSTSTVKGDLNMSPALWTMLHSCPVPCLKVQARPDGVGVR